MDRTEVQQQKLQEQLEALTLERDQLAEALESRILIEQAKGVLAERYHLTIDDAFLLLRGSARSARTKIHDVARDVVSSRETPQAVIRAMARDSRLRASSMRERSEATAERTGQLQARHAQQADRVNRPTARVRVATRADAVDLASRLGGYRWYLIVPDESHWEVVIEYEGSRDDLPSQLRARIEEWLATRSLSSVQVKLPEAEFELAR